MKLIIENEEAQRLIVDMTELALKTGTYPSLVRRLHYLAEYGIGGSEMIQVTLTGCDGGDRRKGHSIGVLWEKRKRPRDEWERFMVGGLVYHEGVESDIAWAVHT